MSSSLVRLTEGLDGLNQALRVQRGVGLHRSLPRPAVGTTPFTVVHRQNKLRLKHYAPAGDAVVRTPVVVVPSMINRAYICDLQSDRSLVGGLAALGHPVYLVDWGEPGAEDAEQSVADVVLSLLARAVDRACRHARTEQAFVLGYCQGGVLACMLSALRPRRIRGLVALATPVKFREGGRFAALCAEHVCDPDALVGDDGLVSADTMAPAFKLLDPMGNWHKFLALDGVSADPIKLERALARERWLEENVAVPGRLAREFIRNGYQQDRLLGGTWALRGQRVDLSAISCPLLVTPCSRDFIAPPAACLPLAEATSSSDITVSMQPTGHIGVLVGSHGPRVYYPLLDAWFRRVAKEDPS